MTSQGDMKNTFICLTVMIVREGGHLNAFGVLVARKTRVSCVPWN